MTSSSPLADIIQDFSSFTRSMTNTGYDPSGYCCGYYQAGSCEGTSH
jgi:hypothetical protein